VRRVLIVSPHFPPSNAPDHQRVRIALPFFKDFCWLPTVLTVDARRVNGARDPLLEQTLPWGLQVTRTAALRPNWTRLLGVGSLAYRAQPYLRRAGDALLREGNFDLVLFSTTVFPVMALGPRWKKKFGVSYVLDFQDPWVSNYYAQHPERRPPGGRLKYGFAQWLARRLEPAAVRGAGHVACVSPAYVSMLRARYSQLSESDFTVLPFAAPESDFEVLPKLGVKQSLFDPNDGCEHWVYVGRGGRDMALAWRAFFQALEQMLKSQPELRKVLRLHFAGTDYAPADRATKTVEPLAKEVGLDDIVTETTDRLPYFEALQCLLDADALIVPGSDDPGYTASKIYPYILARKPLLAIFHEQSSVVDVLRKTKAGTVIPFRSGETPEAISARILASNWLRFLPLPPVGRGTKGEGFGSAISSPPFTDWLAFEPYTARSMTQKLCAIFDEVVRNH